MVEKAFTKWRAGLAGVLITPGEALWLAGWAVRKEPARGALSELRADVLVLEDARGEKLVLVCVDLIAMPRGLCDEIVRRAGLDVRPENFIFAASHTHCGPEIRMDKVRFFGIPDEFAQKIEPTAQRIAEQVAGAIRAAALDLEEVTVHVSTGSVGFAHNRRATGGMQDHDVPVLCVRRGDGSAKAIVFGYACHNLTLPPEDLRYSSDFSGAARERLEKEFAGAKAMFVTGCAADQNPEPRGKVELVAAHGNTLADAVTAAMRGTTMEVKPRVRAAIEEVEFAMQEVTSQSIEDGLNSSDPPRRMKAVYLKERIERGETLERSYTAPMQAVMLGEELLWILMSGEPVAEWAVRFRKEFAGPMVWISGYCNDMFGYIPTRRIQEQGGYEGGRANLWSALPSPWTEDVEERVEAGIRRVVARATRP